jgi:hypothetical protein
MADAGAEPSTNKQPWMMYQFPVVMQYREKEDSECIRTIWIANIRLYLRQTGNPAIFEDEGTPLRLESDDLVCRVHEPQYENHCFMVASIVLVSRKIQKHL